MTEEKKIRSASTSIRSNYLFLGLYLIAKLDLESRSKNKDYLRAFERMEKYFTKKLDNSTDLITDVNTVVIPFTKSMDHFFSKYRLNFGYYEEIDNPFPDYLSYELSKENQIASTHHQILNLEIIKSKHVDYAEKLSHEIDQLKSQITVDIQDEYWKEILNFIETTPNPMSSPAVTDYIQLLQINCTITQDKQLIERLDIIRKKQKINRINWRLGDNSFVSGLRWPNKVVYKDQQTFVNLISNINISFEKGLIDHVERTIEDGWEAKDSLTDKERIWYIDFYYYVLPIYRWFFIFLLGKHEWTEDDWETIKYWLILINEALYNACNIFGNKYINKEMPIDKKTNKYFHPLNYQEDSLGKITWGRIKKSPKLPF